MNAIVVNAAAVEVATLVQRMHNQYFTHVAAMYVARDPRAEALAPPVEDGQNVPILRIPRRDGNDMQMWFNHYLKANSDPLVRDDFDRTWLRTAVLTVNDALGEHEYFGHAPEAEMIRHLRNGIGHKNRFSFTNGVVDKRTGRLKHPAHILRWADHMKMPHHQIDTHLQDTEVLWAWGGPDAIIDCLTVLGVYLWHVGHDLPLHAGFYA